MLGRVSNISNLVELKVKILAKLSASSPAGKADPKQATALGEEVTTKISQDMDAGPIGDGPSKMD